MTRAEDRARALTFVRGILVEVMAYPRGAMTPGVRSAIAEACRAVVKAASAEDFGKLATGERPASLTSAYLEQAYVDPAAVKELVEAKPRAGRAREFDRWMTVKGQMIRDEADVIIAANLEGCQQWAKEL